jgi:hypothetical protein
MSYRMGLESVVDPQPALLRRDEPSVDKHLHVMRHSRCSDAQLLDKVASAHLVRRAALLTIGSHACGKQVENLASRSRGERLEDEIGSLVIGEMSSVRLCRRATRHVSSLDTSTIIEIVSAAE